MNTPYEKKNLIYMLRSIVTLDRKPFFPIPPKSSIKGKKIPILLLRRGL